MKKLLRYIFPVLLLAGAAGIFLVQGAAWYLNTTHFRTWILDLLNQHIPGTVSIQLHHVSLSESRIELWNVQITDPSGMEIAGAEHLNIFFSWTDLIRGKLHIRSASIESSRFRTAVESDGSLNWLHTFSFHPESSQTSSSSSSDIFPLTLDALTLTDASYQHEDTELGTDICLEHASLTGSTDLPSATARAEIHAPEGRISSPGYNSVIGPVSIQAVLTADGQLMPLEISAASPAVKARISGSFSQIWDTPQAHLIVDLDGDLPEIRRNLALSTSLSGLLHAAANVSGSVENPDASVRLSGDAVTVSGYLLDHLQMDAHLEDRVLQVDPLSVHAGKGTVRVTGSTDFKPAFPSGFFSSAGSLAALSSTVSIQLTALELSRIHETAAGIIDGSLILQAQGTTDRLPKTDLRMDLHAARIALIPGISPIDIHLNGQAGWDSGRIQIHHLVSQAGSTRLTASGQWNAQDNAISGELSCQSDNLSASLSPLGVRNTSGSLQVEASLSGRLNHPEGSLHLKSSRLGFQNIQIGALDVDAKLNPSGMLHISDLILKNKGSAVTGSGDILILTDPAADTHRPFIFNAAFHQVQPADFISSSPVKGIIDGSIKLDGSGKSMTGVLQVQGKNISLPDVRLGDLSGEIHLLNGQARVEPLFLQNRQSHAEITGSIQLFEPGTLQIHPDLPFHVSASGSTLSAENFVDFLKGDISLNASLQGSLKQISGTAAIQSKLLDTGFQKFAAVDIAADLQNNRLTVSRAHATLFPDAPLDISGWIAADNTFHAELAASGVAVEHLDALADAKFATGKLRLNLSGNGSVLHPRIQGTAVLDPFRFHDIKWDQTRIQMDWANDLIQLQMQSPFRCTATYQAENRDFTAAAEFVQTDLAPFFLMAGLSGMGGNISGTLKTSGNTASLKTLKADAAFSDLSVTLQAGKIIEGSNLQLVFQNEAIVIPANRLRLLQEGSLVTSGEARPGQSVMLNLDADVPLHAAGLIKEAFSGLKGNLTASAQLKGAWSKPDLDAVATIHDGGWTLDQYAQDIHDVNGQIRITPQSVVIDHLDGQLGNGRLSLQGKADLAAYDIRKMDFRMIATSLPIHIPDTLDMRLNADLSILGTQQAPAVQGEVVLLEGLYYKDINLNPLKILTARNRKYQEKQEIVFPSAIQSTNLDIWIPPRNPFIWENNLAQLRLSPDMHVTGTLQRPVINGRTQINSGTLQYQGNTFTVKKGFLDFINPYTFATSLDIQSQADIQSWTVFLDISGPLDKLNLKLSSSPFLDDNDLFSLLLMGKTSRNAISNTGGKTSSTQKMLADLLSTSVGTDLKKTSGLDILEVDTTSPNRYVNDDPLKVTVGKIISPQVTFKYSVETRLGETVQRATAEYMMIENLILSGFQDNQEGVGGEIKYRHEFRLGDKY